jgi:hypothetical protein
MLFAPALHADSWPLPVVVTVTSPSSNYIAQVFPGSRGYGGYADALTNRQDNASVILSVRLEHGITKVVWTGKLVNPAAPVEVYVSDAGYLVTMDNWHQVGHGSIVAIYDPKGHLLRHWTLEELFKPEERRQLSYSASSIWWHPSNKAHFGVGDETNTFVVPAVAKSFRFALTNGTLLMPSPTLTNAEPGGPVNRSQPVRSETLRTSEPAGSGR